jgi:lipopolysaccharide transport system ATP-binding protein
MAGAILEPVNSGQTVCVKFTWEAWLNAGDYFIDLGCASVENGESVPLDRRYGIVHLVVRSEAQFSGHANLRATVEEVHRES